MLTRTIAVGAERKVSSVWAVPTAYPQTHSTGLILAHGAGNDMTNPFLGHVHRCLAQRGVLTVKFNFPYKEQGRKAPDRAPILEATWRAVVERVRGDPQLRPNRLFLGGKSMGGRMASHLAAAGEPCDGLVFLGYPLHPARKPEQLRAAHLKDVTAPMLFVQGTRDDLCDLDRLQAVLGNLRAPATLHVVDGGDHSFKVPKRLGRSEAEVWHEIVEVVAAWLETNPAD